ncbi:uncharacterized protein EV420DRAFT_1752014 [Desarmillaria tabescens]|uniref:Uncharacterized protein n=1 Tax=Armillaria tabescens TaxID=1929756 RepID=A0AA39JJ88_ARMTA|nr:uncharacterized protein EV420DRAFT_1752014 [Desarmillaria tabescens]KAK0443678.1 hypothetical protein EV420DRAFT_1752014 [Desarmillaria tabescens]
MTTNTLPLARDMLEMLLKFLCDQLSDPGSPYYIPSLLLVIHGGAAMLLHPSYQTIPTSRQSTLDVDYLAKPFGEDVRTTLTRAITETSRAFPGLGADWMNADADVALPPGVWEGSTHPGNLTQNTIFERGSVRMVSVSPGWAVGLKLMRYEKYDAGDVVVILLNGLRVKGGGKWTQEIVEQWVRAECATMGYDAWPAWKLAEMRVRIRDAVRLVEDWLRDNPGVITKTIARQTSIMSVQEEAEIREWEKSLRRKKRAKPKGRYLMGEWVEPDDSDSDSGSDSDSESDTSTEGDESPPQTGSYHPPTSSASNQLVPSSNQLADVVPATTNSASDRLISFKRTLINSQPMAIHRSPSRARISRLKPAQPALISLQKALHYNPKAISLPTTIPRHPDNQFRLHNPKPIPRNLCTLPKLSLQISRRQCLAASLGRSTVTKERLRTVRDPMTFFFAFDEHTDNFPPEIVLDPWYEVG